MRYAMWIGRAIIAAIAVALVVGAMLPVKHTVTREMTYKATPGQLFALIRNVNDYPAWQPAVSKVETLPDVNGNPSARETNGGMAVTYVFENIVPDVSMVSRIADPKLPFGGTWTYELVPHGDATTLRITENGEVYNVMFRFVSKFIMGHSATIDKFLKAVGSRYPVASAGAAS